MIIKHAIKGRVRFEYKPLKQCVRSAEDLEQYLLQTDGIDAVRFNFKCASIIVEYDAQLQSTSRLIPIIEASVARYAGKVSEKAAEELSLRCGGHVCRAESDRQAELRLYKRQFIGLTAVGAAAFLKQRLWGGVVAQGLFSPLGIIGAICAVPLLKSAAKDIREKKKVTLNSFLAGGIVSALTLGEAATAIEILWVHSGSEWLEAKVADSARKAISGILEVSEKTAYIVQDGVEIEVTVDQIKVGDVVTVRTDEKISVDGEVLSGSALVNEAPINGRSELILKQAGTQVYAGTLVTDGVIYVRAEKVGDKTYLSRILYMVEDSLDNKADIELEADRLANSLVKLGLLTTGLTWLLTRNFTNAFSVLLVMSCPCATILAASSAVSAAISNAAKRGILIKGGRYLEEAGRQTCFCFDKTGTLTDKTLQVTQILPAEGVAEEDVLRAAYIAELHNRHPLGLAIRRKAEELGMEHAHHSVCNVFLGKGVRAESDGSVYVVGNAKLMRDCEIAVDAFADTVRSVRASGKTVMFVAKDGEALGLICASTTVKKNAHQLLNELRAEGVERLIMLTGDEKDTAANMAKELNFDQYYSSLLPEEKAVIIADLQKGCKTAMVGDGINDVLALANADLGIAMGAMGSDVAIETADIALADDDLAKIVHLRKLSRKTNKVIHQNYMLATGSNLFGAALGFMGLLNPIMAGAIHIVHTAGVVANSSRLLRYEPDKLAAADTTGTLKTSKLM